MGYLEVYVSNQPGEGVGGGGTQLSLRYLRAVSSPPLNCGAASEPGTPAVISSSCQAVSANHAVLLCRFMRGPSPSPVAAAVGQQPVRTDEPDDVLTAIKVAKITNWNEPPATEARSAPVQRGFALPLRGRHEDEAHWIGLRAHSYNRLELFFFFSSFLLLWPVQKK